MKDNTFLYITVGVTAISTLLASKSSAFSFSAPKTRLQLSASNRNEINSDTERFLQDDRTKAREISLTNFDYSAQTSAFDRDIAVENCYGDDVVGMVKHLPVLFDECKKLEETAVGKEFINFRMPIYIVETNKMEGTLTKNASEGDTFNFLLGLLSGEKRERGELIFWQEDGDSAVTEAWYEQCNSHLEALLMMIDWATAGEPLTTEKLLKCHSALMKGAVAYDGSLFESRFRKFDEAVHADQYIFPFNTNHEEDLAIALEEIDSKFDTVHPVEWSCDILEKVLGAHPFLNGNGRMAHLCYAYGLVRHGVPCAIVFSDWHSKARAHFLSAVKKAQGQKGEIKRKGLHAMGVVGLFVTLQDMVAYCDKNKAPKGGN